MHFTTTCVLLPHLTLILTKHPDETNQKKQNRTNQKGKDRQIRTAAGKKPRPKKRNGRSTRGAEINLMYDVFVLVYSLVFLTCERCRVLLLVCSLTRITRKYGTAQKLHSTRSI